jgi:hypothetical protein
MKLRAKLLLMALAGALWAAAPPVASAATLPVSGTFITVSEGSCGNFVQTGLVLRFTCADATETWTGGLSGSGTFDSEVTVNLVTGQFTEAGSEEFVGCVGQDSCGTLTWSYHATGQVDLLTGQIVAAQGEQHFTGGTGDLAGAHGSIRFSLLGDDPATYEGTVIL